MARQPQMGTGVLVVEVTQSHSFRHATLSVGLWTSDRPVAETADNTQHSQDTDIHTSGGIRTRNPKKRAGADPRLRPRGHRDKLT